MSEHRVELHSENYTQEAQGFKCSHCGLVAKTKYSVNRHIQRKHIGVEKPVLPIEENSIVPGVQKIHLELESLIEIFQSEGVDLPMLLAFNETEMKECM